MFLRIFLFVKVDPNDEDEELYIIDIHPMRNIAKAVSKQKIDEIPTKNKDVSF